MDIIDAARNPVDLETPWVDGRDLVGQRCVARGRRISASVYSENRLRR